MEETPAIIISGNPVDGLMFIGPFKSLQAACSHAEEFVETEWWVTELWPAE